MSENLHQMRLAPSILVLVLENIENNNCKVKFIEQGRNRGITSLKLQKVRRQKRRLNSIRLAEAIRYSASSLSSVHVVGTWDLVTCAGRGRPLLRLMGGTVIIHGELTQ